MISLPLYGLIFDEVGKATFPIPDQFMAPIKSAEAPKITKLLSVHPLLRHNRRQSIGNNSTYGILRHLAGLLFPNIAVRVNSPIVRLLLLLHD